MKGVYTHTGCYAIMFLPLGLFVRFFKAPAHGSLSLPAPHLRCALDSFHPSLIPGTRDSPAEIVLPDLGHALEIADAVDRCEIPFAPPLEQKPWYDSITLLIPTNNGFDHGFKVQDFVHQYSRDDLPLFMAWR